MMKKILVILTLAFSIPAFSQMIDPKVKREMDATSDGIPWEKKLDRTDIQTLIGKLPKGQKREALSKIEKSCFSKDWMTCHTEMYDLEDIEGYQMLETDENYWQGKFPDRRSNRILNAINDLLNEQPYKDDYQIVLNSAYKDSRVSQSYPAREAIYSSVRKENVYRIIETRLNVLRVPYNIRYRMSKRRADMIRFLTISYAARGDFKTAYKGLEFLYPYGKMKTEDNWTVNQTYNAVKAMSAAQNVSRTPAVKDTAW